jgi:putative ABC transport system permease protein
MTPAHTPPRLVVATYRLILRGYPSRIHRQFGAEQLQLFEDLWRDERPSGRLGVTLWTMRQFWRATRAGAAQHIDRFRGSPLRPQTTTSITLSDWGRDARFAVRTLRRAPGFALTSLFVLGAGITLTTVVFAIVDGVLFRPLPYRDADQVFLVRAGVSSQPQSRPPAVSGREIDAWRRAAPEMQATIVRSESGGETYFEGRPYKSRTVDERFFETLGIHPMLGGFTSEDFNWNPEGEGDAFRPVILSDRLWHVLFAGDPGAIGRSVVTSERDGRRWGLTLRGVLPTHFVYPIDLGERQPDLLSPESSRNLGRSTDDVRHFQLIVRIPDREAKFPIESKLRGVLPFLAASPSRLSPHDATPDGRRDARAFDQIALVPVGGHLGQRDRPSFALVMAAAVLLLLLACVNLAGLAAAKNIDRQRDLVVRRALGATSWAITRGLFVEVSVLSAVATLSALAAAKPLLAWTIDMLPATMSTITPPAIDLRVFGGAALTGLLAASLVTAWPAVVALRLSRTTGPMQLGRTATRLNRQSGRLIVVTQSAAGFVLLTAGGLAVVSLANAWRNDVGYRRDQIVMIEAFARKYTTGTDRLEQLERARNELGRVPGVAKISATSLPILKPGRISPRSEYVPLNWTGPFPGVDSRRVDVDFFDITNLRFIEGERPSPAGWADDQPVAIVSQHAARLMWPGRSAIGQTLRWAYQREGQPVREWRVTGVVADGRYRAIDQELVGDIYVPGAIGRNTTGSFFVASTTASPGAVASRLRDTATRLGLNVERTMTISDALWASVTHRVLPAWLFGSLGFAGLLVVAAGVLGLLAMTAAQRTRELAIRRALGATPRHVVGLLAREQVLAAVCGVAAGAVVSLLTVRYLESQLYGVRAYDPLVWGSVALALIAVSLLGTLVPATRAARVDPAATLRAE